ncbi:MAG: STAS domain-containing protein [Pontiellaceae bacterium]|nr:STAS domain-containing protein [Pontiellaceae bacterium]
MNEGKILYAEVNGIYVVHPVGNVRYTISRGLDKLIAQIQKDEQAKDVIVDLSEADFIDSTNFGLLARLASMAFKKFQRIPQLISNNQNINRVLESMGFEQIFNIADNWLTPIPEDEALEEVEIDQASPFGVADLLAAHRQLSEMNGRNAEAFHNVIELLTAEEGC